MIRSRPRLVATLGFGTYLMAGLWVTGIPRTHFPVRAESCAAPLLGAASRPGGPGTLTVLQGNAWMLPERPLLLPYAFSTERLERLERLVRTVRACRPDVVLLQEVFEKDLVDLLARSLPEYRLHTSGEKDLAGTVNSSGLVTLARVPIEAVRFHPFAVLPSEAQTIERLGRKGFLSVRVRAPGFRGEVVNLHLYAFRDRAEERYTRAQLAEVLAYADAERVAGTEVLVAGDFNLDRSDLERMSVGWAVADHGPTYDPVGNPYTVEGSNDRPEKHADHRLGRSVRTIDHLLSSPTALSVDTDVLRGLLLSDHYFLEHRISMRATEAP